MLIKFTDSDNPATYSFMECGFMEHRNGKIVLFPAGQYNYPYTTVNPVSEVTYNDITKDLLINKSLDLSNYKFSISLYDEI